MPTIDVSMIARLDELGVPLSQRPAFEPPGRASAPPEPAARSPDPRAFAPPGAFGPPPAAEAPLGVERSTRAIRIEREQREVAAQPSAASNVPSPTPRRSSGAGVVVAVVLIAAIAIGILLIATR
jgi:hypothetical protein